MNMSTVLGRIYISPCYTSIFSKGDNVCHYLFVSLDEKALPKFYLYVLALKICSYKRKLFSLTADLLREGRRK